MAIQRDDATAGAKVRQVALSSPPRRSGLSVLYRSRSFLPLTACCWIRRYGRRARSMMWSFVHTRATDRTH
jgi:hypothetical protein